MTDFMICHCSCGKGMKDFETSLHYLEHLNIAYKCVNCDKAFLTKRDMSSHTKNVHEGKIKCECCDRFFSNKYNLNK